jgi:hypothetical protein
MPAALATASKPPSTRFRGSLARLARVWHSERRNHRRFKHLAPTYKAKPLETTTILSGNTATKTPTRGERQRTGTTIDPLLPPEKKHASGYCPMALKADRMS